MNVKINKVVVEGIVCEKIERIPWWGITFVMMKSCVRFSRK
jgi:hypothetical protein